VLNATLVYRFDILVWPSERDPKKPMDPKTHCDFLKALFNELGINTTKVGHAFRPAAALEASLHGYVISAPSRFKTNSYHKFCSTQIILELSPAHYKNMPY
jgi:hypothetical protein